MELRFSPLFSGSSGNSLYVGCDCGHLLVDAGVSCARVVAELRRIGVSPAQLAGILVTHEHIDHIRGVGVLSRKYDLPVFATEGSWAAMEEKLGGVAMKNVRVLEPREDFYLGGMNITPFDIPHDAAQPVGYSIALGGARLSVATDIGCVRDSWLGAVAGSDAVILESNYDPDMLRAGPYPYALKQRILGRRGHLANDDAGRAAVELVRQGARRIILGHLSKENNFPALAERCCAMALEEEGVRLGEDVEICVANRDGLTGMFSVRMALI
ncbi:MAG TPA: MBL fold metallo-hydrolase [Candidatus Pullichristensenella avicola]|nr:MBL fold metallo-hydrolase [Candidatus Pullichristensenella avicola]